MTIVLCIRNDILQWLSVWLSGRTQRFVFDGISFDHAPGLSDVPQGSVLGRILFLITDTLHSLLFADYYVRFRNIRRSEHQTILQCSR